MDDDGVVQLVIGPLELIMVFFPQGHPLAEELAAALGLRDYLSAASIK